MTLDVVSDFVGIVSFLTEVAWPQGSPDLFVAAASGHYMDLLGGEDGAKVAGSGAGLTWEVASGAAIGECLERYSSAIVDPSDLLLGSFEQLEVSGRTACPPDEWALFDASQDVPYVPFTRTTRIAWREGWDLCTGSVVHVPACLAYLSSSPHFSEDDCALIGPAISTGCSCAVDKESALVGGVCELIERDAFMIVWRNRLSIPEVVIDPASRIYETYTQRFCRPGLQYRIWRTTLDHPVPSFFGMLIDRRRPNTRMIVGGAASLDADCAVLKTLCELTQGLSWMDSSTFKDSDGEMGIEDIHSFTDRARFYVSRWRPEVFTFLQSEHDPLLLSSFSSQQLNASDALRFLVTSLTQKSLHPVAIDLTTSDVRDAGFSVTRVLVPGLETMDGDHHLQMLGGKRWREVPVNLGLRTAPIDLAHINPYPHPYP